MDKKQIVTTLLENHIKYYEDCMHQSFSEDWNKRVMQGITHAVSKTDLWEIVSIQPMTGPVGTISYFNYTYEPGEETEESTNPPTVKINVEERAVAAMVRSLGIYISEESTQEEINTSLMKAFNGLRAEVFNDLRIAAEANTTEVDPNLDNEPWNTIITQVSKIGYRTLRGPGNRIICHPKCMKLFPKERFKVYTDERFPQDQIVLYRMGPSRIDAPYVFAPYRFNFNDSGYTCFRYSKRLVHPEALALIKMKS